MEGIKAVVACGDIITDMIFLSRENRIYGIERVLFITEISFENSEEIYNQMLSTFRFIEQDETSDWQTYRNDEYGFEMKYPENFFTEQVLEPKTKIIQCDYANFLNNCPTEVRNINGVPFCLEETGGAGAGTTYTTYNYTTVIDRECFVVSFTVAYLNCSNFLPIESQEIQEAYDKCMLDNEVTKPETINKILSTFKFIKN